MRKRISTAIENLVLAWAEKIKGHQDRRREKRNAEHAEAQHAILGLIGGRCVYAEGEKRIRYCDRCPLGDQHSILLSRGAQRVLCTRRRRYSK